MEFGKYHPIIIFTYLVAMIVFSCVFMHPVYLCISLVSAVSYGVVLNGIKKQAKHLGYILPMAGILCILNPLFNHQGQTVLYYIGENPVTSESVVYGIAAAMMIISVVGWFSCYSKIMTSDKFVYLFGKVIPSLSLVLSMALRFVPRFHNQLKNVADAQNSLNTPKGFVNSIKYGTQVLSSMLIWSFESALTTADSMKSRGYGTNRRTAFSVYRFDRYNIVVFSVVAVLIIYIIIGAVLGVTRFTYYPNIQMLNVNPYNISVLCAYIMLAFMPHIIEFAEVIRWQATKSKI